METPRMRALRELKNQMPVANQQVANQYKAANDIAFQQTIAGAPTNIQGNQASAVIGGQQAQQLGAAQVQQAQNNTQLNQQLGQHTISEGNLQHQTQLRTQQRDARDQEFQGAERLSAISHDAKVEIFDRRMDLLNNQQQRRYLDQRQLADYALLNAASDEEARNYSQQVQLAQRAKQQVMKAAYDTIRQELDQANKFGEKEKANELEDYLRELQKQAKADQDRKEAEAGLLTGILGTGFSIFGAFFGQAEAGEKIGTAAGQGINALRS